MTWSLGKESYRFATHDDLPSMVEMLADPEVGRWLWFAPLPAEGVRAYFQPLLDAQEKALAEGKVPEASVFTVEDPSGYLGHGAVVAVEGSAGGYEIGFQLRRQAWGRGVGTRLARFLCAWAVYRKRAYRIEAGCLEGNVGSQRVLEGLGLQREGRRPGYRLKEDARHAEILFGAEVADLDVERIEGWGKDAGLESNV